MTIPQDYLPRAPQPPAPRVEAAALAICDALAGERFGRQRGGKRVVDLRDACGGFRRFGRENSIPPDDYRWATQLMVEAGLLECVEAKPPSPLKDEFFADQPGPPEYVLVSTLDLWTRWRTQGGLLCPRGEPLPGPLGDPVTPPVAEPNAPASSRVRCDEGTRSVFLDDRCLAEGMVPHVFRFFKAIADAHPEPIKFKAIRERAPGLHGKHSTRDLKNPLPRALKSLVKSGRDGYYLTLPPL